MGRFSPSRNLQDYYETQQILGKHDSYPNNKVIPFYKKKREKTQNFELHKRQNVNHVYYLTKNFVMFTLVQHQNDASF